MGLVAWVPCIADLRNQGINVGTVTSGGTPTYSSTGGKLGGMYTTNIGDIRVPYTALSTNKITITFWCKINGWSAWSDIFTMSGSKNRIEQISTNESYCWYADSYSFMTTGTSLGTITSGVWHFFVFTFDGSSATLKVDGVQKAKSTEVSITLSQAISGNRISFGSRDDASYCNASYNDIRIYDNVLSDYEINQIAKGLICHYTLTSEGVLPAITNYATDTALGGWDNSGSASRSNNNTAQGSPLQLPVYSITTTSAGEQCITFGTATSTALRGKQISASCWMYIVGSSVYNSPPYIRSSKYDNGVLNLTYNGNGSFTQWPRNQWIRVSGTGTVASDETGVYFCNYIGNSGEVRYYTGWQIELYGEATPYIAPGTSRSSGIVYDSSGYCRNLSITGSVSPSDSPIYDKGLYLANLNINSNYLIANGWSPSGFLTTGSISFWCKFNGLGNSGWLPFTGLSGSYYVMAWNNSGNFYHGEAGSTSAITIYRDGVVVTAPSDNGNWHHYCITGINISGWTQFRVNHYGNTWNSNMYISDIRIYNTVLSANDVRELYNLGNI